MHASSADRQTNVSHSVRLCDKYAILRSVRVAFVILHAADADRTALCLLESIFTSSLFISPVLSKHKYSVDIVHALLGLYFSFAGAAYPPQQVRLPYYGYTIYTRTQCIFVFRRKNFSLCVSSVRCMAFSSLFLCWLSVPACV